ncbi:MAG TPA: CHAT domain-containing tetratricopeptide repeat protein [Chitinophagaceae bacterium]|nr:CHAT domain-containing tetratricopeptide repeat protein [Chitinophagaceae bacterium]
MPAVQAQPPHTYTMPGEDKEAWYQLLNQGYQKLLAGDIIHSTNAYRVALAWADRHPGLTDQKEILEYILKPLGNNYTRLGDYEQALFIQRRALDIALTVKDNDQLAGAYSNLATTTSSMGNAEQSLKYAKEGLAIVAPNTSFHGLLLSEQADACYKLQQYEAARSSIQKAIAILQKDKSGNSAYWLLVAYQQAGDIYMQEQRPKLALQLYHKALALQAALLQQNGAIRNRERAKLYYRLGSLYLQLKNNEEGGRWLRECIQVLLPGRTFTTIQRNDLYGENTLLDALFAQATIEYAQQHTDEALRLYGLCFATEKKLRKEYVTGTAKERSVAESRLRYETGINAAYNAWLQTGKPVYQNQMLQFIESGKAQLLLEELQQQSKRPAALQSDSVVNYIRPGNQVIRSFFTGTHFLYIIEIDKKGIVFTDRQVITQAQSDSLHSFIQTYFQNGAGEMLNHPEAYYHQAYSIYSRLFGQHPLRPGKEYILLPDGVLSMLPIDALVTTPAYSPAVHTWPFVIKQAAVSYAYSIQTLNEQRRLSQSTKGFAGFFIAANSSRQPELQAVMQEKKGIAATMKNGTWLINDQATTVAFRKALQQSAIVHISTHAFAGTDSSVSPHIQLYDKPFSLGELKGMQQHPSLVVLSACRTGSGRLITGEGVQSLARAFTANGTNGVVAGWWNVNDETTAQVMQQFYTFLSKDINAADALRQAKLRWLADENVSYLNKLPYYWAALNYLGNPAPLSTTGIHQHGAYSIRTVLIASIILFCCILLFWRLRRRSSSIPG